jgi:hypothetical protein
MGGGVFRGGGLTWGCSGSLLRVTWRGLGSRSRSHATRRGLGSRSRSRVTWWRVGAKRVLWAVRDGRGVFSRCWAHLGAFACDVAGMWALEGCCGRL